MAIEYLGLSAINGPMVVLEGVQNAAYDEIVEMTVDGSKKKLGRIIEAYKDKAIIQVFEGTDNMSLSNKRSHPPDRSSDGAWRFRGNARQNDERNWCPDRRSR